MASAALIGRVSVLAVQSVQLGAAINAMPTGSYVKRMAKLMTGQLGWGNALNSPYIQRRLKDMPVLVRQGLAGLNAGKPNQLKHQMSRIGQLIGGADALFTAGTYAMIYDYQLAQNGGDVAMAHTQAERETERVAQPTRTGARSLFENVSTSPAMKLGWAFASEPRQKMAIGIYNLVTDRSASQKARSLFVAFGVGGVIAQIIRAAVRDMRDGGEDPEVFDDRNWNPYLLALTAISSPLQGIPFVGDLIQAGGATAMKQRVPEGNLFSVAGPAVMSTMHLPDDISEGDTQKIIKDAENILTGLSFFSENASAGTSVLHIVRDLFGTEENTRKLGQSLMK